MELCVCIVMWALLLQLFQHPHYRHSICCPMEKNILFILDVAAPNYDTPRCIACTFLA